MLSRGEVLVRWLQPGLADAATLAGWHAVLDPAEQDRAGRFRFEADRRAFIAAHALARSMLAEQGGLPPGDWRFIAGSAGKPELAPQHGRPWLRFNLSHCRSLVACAVASTDDVGLDVEDLDRRPMPPGLAERFFAPEEAAWLADLPPPAHQDGFLRLWTLKEAVVKASGEGLGLGLERFAMRLQPPALRQGPPQLGAPERWRLLQLQPTPRHWLALALRRIA